jgi:hypothetical protein
VTVQIGPLVINTASLPGGLQHLPYSSAVAATGGLPPYTWTITSGALPSGLSLNAGSGAISGTPTALGNFTFTIQARDSSNPARTTSKTLSLSIAAPASSIWSSSTLPTTVDSGDPNAVELGVKFLSDAPGYITGVRFYKATANTGTHIGNLWTTTGTLLATATFSAETASGWQEVSFPEPVLIAANTVYVVSYHTDVGRYSFSSDYFAVQGVANAPLHFPADATVAGNGVYAYGADSRFPTNTYRASNYWVDAVYSAVQPPTAPLTIVTSSIPTGLAGLPYSTRLSASGGALPYRWSLTGGALPPGLALNADGVISGTPTEAGTSSFTVQVTDSSNPVRVSSHALTMNIAIGGPAVSIWHDGSAPQIVDGGPSTPVQLGMTFSSDVGGYIIGARFYKSSANTGAHIANLWTGSGTLLASTTFTAESASGWQQVTFPTPIPISANAVYVVSYHTDIGHYSYTPAYFGGGGAANPPLRPINSVYAYGASRIFPTSSYNATNYWVDVLFSPALTITTAELPLGGLNAPYSALLSRTGGVAPFAWSISSGALPPGLSLDTSTGAISGTPTTVGTYDFTVRVSDSSVPLQAVTSSARIIIATAVNSVWSETAVPALADAGPDNSVELGIQFRADVDGYVAGVRFYKSTSNTGTHTANLWSSDGTLLATATFANETPSGWQQVTFPTPIAVTANTTYVVSYHTDFGHYSVTPNYFDTQGFDNTPLHVPANGGVYAYGTGRVFPNNTYNGANYWVDVIFTRP